MVPAKAARLRLVVGGEMVHTTLMANAALLHQMEVASVLD